VSTRTKLARRWKDLIDFDAGRIATGEATVEETGWDLFRLILEVASGRTKVCIGGNASRRSHAIRPNRSKHPQTHL
jgi:altronate dehydratase